MKLGRHHCFFSSQFSPIIPHVSVLNLNAMVHDCGGYQRPRRHIRRSTIGGCPLLCGSIYIICGSCKGFVANAPYKNNYKTYSRSPPLTTSKPQENPQSKEFKPENDVASKACLSRICSFENKSSAWICQKSNKGRTQKCPNQFIFTSLCAEKRTSHIASRPPLLPLVFFLNMHHGFEPRDMKPS